jgi:hypothetical protein
VIVKCSVISNNHNNISMSMNNSNHSHNYSHNGSHQSLVEYHQEQAMKSASSSSLFKLMKQSAHSAHDTSTSATDVDADTDVDISVDASGSGSLYGYGYGYGYEYDHEYNYNYNFSYSCEPYEYQQQQQQQYESSYESTSEHKTIYLLPPKSITAANSQSVTKANKIANSKNKIETTSTKATIATESTTIPTTEVINSDNYWYDDNSNIDDTNTSSRKHNIDDSTKNDTDNNNDSNDDDKVFTLLTSKSRSITTYLPEKIISTDLYIPTGIGAVTSTNCNTTHTTVGSNRNCNDKRSSSCSRRSILKSKQASTISSTVLPSSSSSSLPVPTSPNTTSSCFEESLMKKYIPLQLPVQKSKSNSNDNTSMYSSSTTSQKCQQESSISESLAYNPFIFYHNKDVLFNYIDTNESCHNETHIDNNDIYQEKHNMNPCQYQYPSYQRIDTLLPVQIPTSKKATLLPLTLPSQPSSLLKKTNIIIKTNMNKKVKPAPISIYVHQSEVAHVSNLQYNINCNNNYDNNDAHDINVNTNVNVKDNEHVNVNTININNEADDVILSTDGMTTCHALILRSYCIQIPVNNKNNDTNDATSDDNNNYNDKDDNDKKAVPVNDDSIIPTLASLAHLDSANYHKSIQRMIDTHVQFHEKNYRKNANMKDNTNVNTTTTEAETSASRKIPIQVKEYTNPIIQMDVHLVGGYDDPEGTSKEITDDIINFLTNVSSSFRCNYDHSNSHNRKRNRSHNHYDNDYSYNNHNHHDEDGIDEKKIKNKNHVDTISNHDTKAASSLLSLTRKQQYQNHKEREQSVTEPQINMILQTCIVTKLNDVSSYECNNMNKNVIPSTSNPSSSPCPLLQYNYIDHKPIIRGVAFCIHSNKLILLNHNVHPSLYGPEHILRSIRLWSSSSTPPSDDDINNHEHEQKYHGPELSTIHSYDKEEIIIKRFNIEPFDGMEEFMNLPDDLILQYGSTSPECEEDGFCDLVREKCKFVLDLCDNDVNGMSSNDNHDQAQDATEKVFHHKDCIKFQIKGCSRSWEKIT